MTDYSRLIEHAFPLRQTSLDSVHEKNVRHGHISTLHLWPARRPLAASRAALLATLLPDPGTSESRKALCERIGGTLKMASDKDGRLKEVTDGGVIRWKRDLDNKEALDLLRSELREANGGRAPAVLDPFSGGGAIPLEAMRLGCEVTSSDLNPVAWFILRCTLEFPQKLSGQTRVLPDFILRDRQFMEDFLKNVKCLKGLKLRKALEALGHVANPGLSQQDEIDFEGTAAKAGIPLDADLAWHVRAWGRKVLGDARKQLAHLYPTYCDWEPLLSGEQFDPRPMQLVEWDDKGGRSCAKLNDDLSREYLANKFNPRWIAKPAVAYLWARTVRCKNCRAIIPLLKTRWICKKDGKRIRLLMEPNADRSGVAFTIERNVLERGGNAAQRRENDKKLGVGTMSRAGAQCPCCPAIMKSEDIRYEGKNGLLGLTMTCVAVDGLNGKEYRLPTPFELNCSQVEVPDNDISRESFRPASTRSISCQLYGVSDYGKLFTDRQLVSLLSIRSLIDSLPADPSDTFSVGVRDYLVLAFSRLLMFNCSLVRWKTDAEAVVDSFSRFSISLLWDFAESSPIGDSAGAWLLCLDRIASALDNLLTERWPVAPKVTRQSVLDIADQEAFDVIMTDPPYYEAVSYADLSDFFYVWNRELINSPGLTGSEKSPKDSEIVQHIRADKDRLQEKLKYERMMTAAFSLCHKALKPHGRFVCVFAHKKPDAWETLVNSIIASGFVVTGSWPIQTEMPSRQRAGSTAALASSVWLICKKRDPLAKVGWDNRVLTDMRENIGTQLREYWDAGIRGPDFVWAATGPAMEAYSKYPAVKKANSPNELLLVSEFLEVVRRIVIEFVVGRVLHIEAGTDRLDSVTSYYLLHRNDFGFARAPAGACILYAVSCGLSDAELERTWNLVNVKGSAVVESDEADEAAIDEDDDSSEDLSGGEFVLRTWKERNDKRMGFESIGGREVPLIDRVHRLMHLWREGDVRRVDDYLDQYALRRHELFVRLIQSLIELSEQGGDERALLESLSNHLGAKDAKIDSTRSLAFDVSD
jgi:putative DNA methylase